MIDQGDDDGCVLCMADTEVEVKSAAVEVKVAGEWGGSPMEQLQ
jgi:hypothetical protein